MRVTAEDTEDYNKANDDDDGDDENENLGGFTDIAEHCCCEDFWIYRTKIL